MTESSLYKNLYLVLQEISHTVVDSDKISSIANTLLDVVINFTAAEAGSLMLLNERGELFILASRGIPPEYIESYRAKLGEGISGIVAKNKRPLFVHDINLHEEFKRQQRDHYKTRSFISCPVIYKEKLLGIININDKRDGKPFTSVEFDLLQIIANHVAVALQNASLMSQLKSTAADLEQMNKRLVESDILKTEFLTRISHELRTPLNSLNGAIYFLQNHDDVSASERKEFYDIITAESNRLSATVENLLKFLQFEDESRIIDKTVVNIDDVLRELSATANFKTSLKALGLQLSVDAISSPIPVVGDKIRIYQLFTNLLEGLGRYLQPGDSIGVSAREGDLVTIEITLPREIPKTVLRHLNSVNSAFQTTLSDDRLKIYLARSIIHAHNWGIAAHNSSGTCLITLSIPRNSKDALDANIHRSLDAFVDYIFDALNLDICSVMLSDDLTGELQVTSARGLDDNIIKRTRIKFGDKIAGWVALEGKPLFIENVEEDPRFEKKSIPQYRTKSFMSLPLKVNDRIIGVLNLNNKEESNPFTTHDFHIAQALSEKISDYIKRIQTGCFQEDEFQQFLSSVDSFIRSESRQPTPPPGDSTRRLQPGDLPQPTVSKNKPH
jgi:GAF domain-containing protein